MKEAFNDKMDEVKRTNYASATLVLKNIKEEKAQIYKQNKDINHDLH